MHARVRQPAVLGIDLGTTEVKAGLVGLDGRLLGLARSGYALDVTGGHGWAEQDPGAWWSAVVGAVRALHVHDARCRRHRCRRPRADARGDRRARRGDAGRDHLPRYAGDGRGRRAGRGHRRSRLGPCRPAGRAVGGAPRTRRRGRDLLVSRHLGMAGLPSDRDRRRTARARPARPGSGPRRGRRRADRPAAAPVRHGRGRRRTRERGCRGARPASRDRRSWVARSTPSRAISAPVCWHPATPTTRADRPAGSGCTGTGHSTCPAAS